MAVLPTGIGPVTGGYQIERSLRFNSADSAYLSRTPASAGNRKTWTWSGWVKRSRIDSGTTTYTIFSNYSGNSDTNYFTVYFYQDGIRITGFSTSWRVTTQVFRDPSSWYHIVVAVDTTQATANNRIRLYVNGVEVTAFVSPSNPSQNADLGMNQAAATYIGADVYTGPTAYFNGYMTEINFIDGQALTPSSFGQTNASTGVWEPVKYTGTYGTNGFYLKFADNSNTTAATLGKDSSGNGNNWTPNNFSVTAGAGNDSLVDTPTSYGTDTGVGGEVRGNYATLNPLARWDTMSYAGVFSDGNLQGATGGNPTHFWSSILISSGDTNGWYWEGVCTSLDGARTYIGVVDPIDGPSSVGAPYVFNSKGVINSSGQYFQLLTNGSHDVTYTSFTTNDVLMVAYKNGKLWVGKNGTWMNSGNPSSDTGALNTTTLSTSKNWIPYFGYNSTWVANFGQRPFAYTAPSGFKALCTQNLPTPTIGATSTTQANKYFNPVLYTGNGSTQSITGVGFQPDFVWIKNRGTATDHGLFDAIRGTTKRLSSNLTSAETTEVNSLTAFNSDGFSVGATQDFNQNTVGIVAWNWNAGGSNQTISVGQYATSPANVPSIASTVRANTTAGFSIVTYTGNGSAGATVGHGLGVAPSIIIVKRRTVSGGDWAFYHASLGATQRIDLNATTAAATSSIYWNNTTPTSSVFTIGTSGNTNQSSESMLAYCFAAVAGYSAFGSYTGNGSNDGVFVYTGFRPRWILVKRTDSTGGWHLYDTARDTYNAATKRLQPNLSNAENTANGIIDILSNGWKFRNTNTDWDASGGTYIYAAFAESPFKYALAR